MFFTRILISGVWSWGPSGPQNCIPMDPKWIPKDSIGSLQAQFHRHSISNSSTREAHHCEMAGNYILGLLPLGCHDGGNRILSISFVFCFVNCSKLLSISFVCCFVKCSKSFAFPMYFVSKISNFRTLRATNFIETSNNI